VNKVMNFWFCRMLEVSSITELLTASQEGLMSVECVYALKNFTRICKCLSDRGPLRSQENQACL
jgi:hypothetical protein